MGINLEIKLKYELNKNLFDRIKDFGAEFVESLFQKDTYYNYTHGLLKLREQNGKFSLIKYNRNEHSSERWSNYSILNIEGDNVENYLKELLTVESIVEKKRDLYLYKNTRIHLDKVKILGEFIELETVADKISQIEAKDEFEFIVESLKLDKSKEIRKSYRDLLREN